MFLNQTHNVRLTRRQIAKHSKLLSPCRIVGKDTIEALFHFNTFLAVFEMVPQQTVE